MWKVKFNLHDFRFHTAPIFPIALSSQSAYIQTMFSDLYNTDILSLASTLENGRLDKPHGTARKVSKLCGSWLEIDLYVKDGKVSDMALRLEACALGQASAGILKAGIIEATVEELRSARDGLKAMLKEKSEPPAGRFDKLALLAGVADYPARHISTLLAFDAAVVAMESALEREAI